MKREKREKSALFCFYEAGKGCKDAIIVKDQCFFKYEGYCYCPDLVFGKKKHDDRRDQRRNQRRNQDRRFFSHRDIYRGLVRD